MSQHHIFSGSAPASVLCPPSIQFECALASEVAAISSFVDNFIHMLTEYRCIPGSEGQVEIALREALYNAVVHGNREDPRRRVCVKCRCESGDVSIAVKDEGQGFDVNKVPDPTVPGCIYSTHGRGIYLMKAFMDEVRFEEGGSLVHMRKHALRAEPEIRAVVVARSDDSGSVRGLVEEVSMARNVKQKER